MARRPLPVRTADGWKCPVIGERRPHLKRRLAAPRLPTGRGPLRIDSCLRAPLETIAAQLFYRGGRVSPERQVPDGGAPDARSADGLSRSIRAAPARALRPRHCRSYPGVIEHRGTPPPARTRRHESPGRRRPPPSITRRGTFAAAKRLSRGESPSRGEGSRARPSGGQGQSDSWRGRASRPGSKKKSGSRFQGFPDPDHGSRIPSRSFHGHLRNPLRPPRRHHRAVRRRRDPGHRDTG